MIDVRSCWGRHVGRAVGIAGLVFGALGVARLLTVHPFSLLDYFTALWLVEMGLPNWMSGHLGIVVGAAELVLSLAVGTAVGAVARSGGLSVKSAGWASGFIVGVPQALLGFFPVVVG